MTKVYDLGDHIFVSPVTEVHDMKLEHIFVFPDQSQRDGGPYSWSQQRPKHEDHLFHLYCQIWLLFLLLM